MLNLLIIFDNAAWTKSSTFMDKDCCLTEYILPEFKERYAYMSKEGVEQWKEI